MQFIPRHSFALAAGLALVGCNRLAPCEGDRVPTGGGEPSGYVDCRSGGRNKVSAATVTTILATCEDAGGATVEECTTKSDCQPDEFCKFTEARSSVTPSQCFCTPYPCSTDEDCGDGDACYVDGYCIQADCRSGQDCESGQCGVTSTMESTSEWTIYIRTLRCRSVEDECKGDEFSNDCSSCSDEFLCLDE